MSAPNETPAEDLRNALCYLEAIERSFVIGDDYLTVNNMMELPRLITACSDRLRAALEKLERTPNTCPECYEQRQLVSVMQPDDEGQLVCIWCHYAQPVTAPSPATTPAGVAP